MHKFIHQIEEKRQAIFVGFFGPIGVSAVFYLYISLEFLEEITVEGVQRADAAKLAEVIKVVVWFLAICSIVSATFQNKKSHQLISSGCSRSINPSRKTRILPPKNIIPSLHIPRNRGPRILPNWRPSRKRSHTCRLSTTKSIRHINSRWISFDF